MAIVAKASGNTDFEPIPEGVHVAVAYGVIDEGLQYSEKFNTSSRKVRILFEIPSETYINKDSEEVPRTTSKDYTLSLNPKATLRKDLESWRGKKFTPEEEEGFDIKNIINKGCQIQIIHEGDKKYAKIAAIMGLPKGVKAPTPVSGNIYFDLSSGDSVDFYDNLMSTLPEFMQEMIKKSETYLEIKNNTESIGEPCKNEDEEMVGEDGIPF